MISPLYNPYPESHGGARFLSNSSSMTPGAVSLPQLTKPLLSLLQVSVCILMGLDVHRQMEPFGEVTAP